MLKQRYILTEKLLANIAQIERLYGQLEVMRIPRQLELNLIRDNLVQSSYISNSIEGNPLSLPEVTNLLLADRVPVNRDEKEVKNYFEILQNLDYYLDQPLSLALTEEVHRRLLTGVNEKIAGKIRNKKVVIGRYVSEKGKRQLKIRHEPPFHHRTQIEKALARLLDWLKENQAPVIVKAGLFHHQFVFIHPFEDGNGRVCRLLTALYFLENNYLINKYFVLDDYYDIDRNLYSEKLHSADAGEKTEWLEYFSDGVKYSLQSALAKLRASLEKMSVEKQPTTRGKEVLDLFRERKDLTTKQVSKKLGISRQQGHRLLTSLIDKGFLVKKGKTKGSYYLLR